MKLAHYKLIASDLDGTLVKSGSDEVSKVTLKVIKALETQGISFTIATGRSWKQAGPIIKDLEIKVPVMVQAGAIIIDPVSGKMIRHQPIRAQLDAKLQRIDPPKQVDWFRLSDTGEYFATAVNTAGGNWVLNGAGEACRVTKLPVELDSVIKHLFIGPGKFIQPLVKKVLKECRPRPNIVLWPPGWETGDWFLEVFDPLASKGQALRWLAAFMKIRQDQVITFGDNDNDQDMLKWAGLGVAVAKAPAHVISQANATIPGPEQDGLARFLANQFGLDYFGEELVI